MASTSNSIPGSARAGAQAISPNAYRLLWAGFMAILAAGIGFSIRGAIFGTWSADFGFSASQNGAIGGAGLSGFCFGIIIGGFVAERIGFGKLVVIAFLLHVVSALVMFGTHKEMAQSTAFLYLFIGTFIFALANGTLEAVANPLVATLFPNDRTHYLNILHASWPAGLVLGGLIALVGGKMEIDWKVQLGLFLVPTAIYGLMFFGQKFPKSEASSKGLKLGEMMQQIGFCGASVVGYLLYLFCRDTLGTVMGGLTGSDFFAGDTWTWLSAAAGLAFVVWVAVITKLAPGHWMMVALFIAHAMVGAVELGTDQWIQNINGNILTPEQGNILFIFTSAVMFALRFCAHFIEKRLGLSPVGILLVCSILAAVGLILSSMVNTLTMAFLALTIYAVGKTFFWPTMLAVASDRFPKTGAVAISMMGGIGMLSAGLIGSPGLGYFKDRYTTDAISETSPQVLAENKAEKTSKWLGFEEVLPLDGSKLEASKKVEKDKRTAAQSAMIEAEIEGSRRALKVDALIPCGMAIIYLLLLLYFKGVGGYKAVKIEEHQA